MADAADDRDVKLQQISGDLFATLKAHLANVLFADAAERGLEAPGCPRKLNRVVLIRAVESARAVLEPFQEAPQLLDPHLGSILTPLNACLLAYFTTPPSSPADAIPSGCQTLAEGVARLLYVLCKARGYKVVSRFFANEPHLLQTIITRLTFASAAWQVDPLEAAVAASWELRFIILLWLGHLLLTPFDLSTISSAAPEAADLPPQDIGAFIPSSDSPFPEKLSALPQLCKTLLLLATKILPSPSQRESDAAALLMVRLAIRRDMRALGLLEAVVEWCLRCWEEKPTAEDIDLLSTHEGTINPLFLRTGALKVLAGLLTQSESGWVADHIPKIRGLVTATEDKAGGADWSEQASAGEWASAGVRKVATKIYRWIGTLLLAGGLTESEESSGAVEDVIGRLLNLLGDRDTNVRFAASKSLGVLTSKLPKEMANEVVNAVVGGFDEDVLYETEHENLCDGKPITSIFGDIQESTPEKKQLLVSVSPEKWHGLTLTLATFLRQRAIKPHTAIVEEEKGESTTLLFQLIIHRIVTALTFDQRRTTFSLGSNVRDAACYAAWALARSYYTKELQSIPLPKQYSAYPDPAHVPPNTIQLLATNLVATACLDPLGNIRRAASAALQELVGRHPNVVEEGIKIVQTVDYGAVSVRRRAAAQVARDAARLGAGYWFGLAKYGIVEGWRGVGSSEVEGRRIAATGLGALTTVRLANETDAQHLDRGRRLLGWLLNRASKEAGKDVEVRHGVYFAIAEVLEGLDPLLTTAPGTNEAVFTPLQQSILLDIFHPLQGRDFVHPPLRPELTAESSCRLVAALCKVYPNTHKQLLTPLLPISTHRLNLAIIEATLEFRGEDAVLEQVIPASRELFKTLDTQSGEKVVQGWCRRVTSEALTTADIPVTAAAATAAGGSGMGRKRGFVGGLGEVIGVMLSPEYSHALHEKGTGLVREGIHVLVAAATRKNDVEMRVAGIRGIMRGVMAHGGGDSAGWLPGVVSALCKGLDDYSVDTRGDVGSWVRTESIEAVTKGWKSHVLGFGVRIPNPDCSSEQKVDVMTTLIPRLLRLAVEKLDKLRSKAFFALKLILHDDPPQLSIPHKESIQGHPFMDFAKYIDFSLPHEIYLDATSPAYFTSLLPILSHPDPDKTLTQALLSGYVLSAGSGTDSLLRAAGGALWNYLDRPEVTNAPLLRAAEGLLLGLKDERILGATLETLGAGLESGVLGRVLSLENGGDLGKRVFMAVQEAIKLSKGRGGVGRVVGAVRVYRGLGIACLGLGGDGDGEIGRKVGGLVRRKLVGMLVHPWPVVRREVGEGLFLCLSLTLAEKQGKGDVKAAVEVLVETDWMGRLEPLRGGKGRKGAERGVKGEGERVKKLLGLV
ncbi:armadillo-type protein [Tirmania nivea]|nr:armadillo-type protein [Tirmania nivea]